MFCRSSSFKEDDCTWKGNEDGKVINNQPTRVLDERNGGMHHAGYIGKYVPLIKVNLFLLFFF